MTQGPSRRLVTEAAQTTALASYLPTSQKGAANGLATLDSSGRLPAAQNPGALFGYKPAITSRGPSAAPAADTDLAPTLVAGVYLIEFQTFWQSSNTSGLIWKIGGSATATQLGDADVDQAVGAPAAAAGVTGLLTANQTTAAAPGTSAHYRITGRLVVTVTVAGTLGFQWHSNGTGTLVLQAGSWLRASRLA